MKVLILGGGLQALSCGASLYTRHSVDIVSSDLQILKSKFFKTIYKKKVIVAQEIFDIIRDGHYDVIIPMGDKNVTFLGKYKNIIAQKYNCRCACPDSETLEIVQNKHNFMKFCQNNDIPHPQTIAITDSNLKEASDLIGFPSLIKPDFSVGARGILKVNSLPELQEHYCDIVNRFGSCTLQEYIDNKNYYYNVMLYRTKDGKFLAHTIIKILRMYPVGGGSSSCCLSVENEELLQICKSCLDKLNWVGMADIDVLQRLDNMEYKIIEINARVPASLKAAAVSGVNFPEIIVFDALGVAISEYIYQPGKIVRYLGLDVLWFLKSRKRFCAKPSWFKFMGSDIYYQDIYCQDCTTWWTWLCEGLIKLIKRN